MDIPVDEVVCGCSVPEEDVVIRPWVGSGGTSACFLSCNFGAFDEVIDNNENGAGVNLGWCHIDGAVVGAVVKSSSMKKGFNPVFGTEACRVEVTTDAFLESPMRAFNYTVLG